MNKKIKTLGQVYTPKNIVIDMLNLISYSGQDILKKNIIDNSCGNGAFLTEIVKRYIDTYKEKNGNLEKVENDLSKYIHGIEIDKNEQLSCLTNLNNILQSYGITKVVDWDIICADTLSVDCYNENMDYVVANPPYVRIHNLQNNFERVRNFKFAKNGMTDLFIVFYEIGFNMLNKNGKLVYITPNSFYSSVAGQEFRNFIFENEQLSSLTDLGHYQPFAATTYTTICMFDKSKKNNSFIYSIYNKDGSISFQEKFAINEVFNNGKMILARKREQKILREMQNYIPKNKDAVQVKNAFATLADNIFIQKQFSFESKYTIDIYKASTGEWKKCIFPYDQNGNQVSFDCFENELQQYFIENEPALKNRSLDKNTSWFAFGRSQGIRDIQRKKIAINTTIKNTESIKLKELNANQGVYSGLYVLTEYSFDEVEQAVKHQDFIDYIATIGKCKSGGYFTFSSNDLKKYLIYKLEKTKNEQQ